MTVAVFSIDLDFGNIVFSCYSFKLRDHRVVFAEDLLLPCRMRELNPIEDAIANKLTY